MRIEAGRDVLVENEPGSHVLSVTCGPECDLTLPVVRAVVAAAESVLREKGRVDVVADARHVGAADIHLALRWVEFVRANDGRARIIVYGVPATLSALLQVARRTARGTIHVAPSAAAAHELARTLTA